MIKHFHQEWYNLRYVSPKKLNCHFILDVLFKSSFVIDFETHRARTISSFAKHLYLVLFFSCIEISVKRWRRSSTISSFFSLSLLIYFFSLVIVGHLSSFPEKPLVDLFFPFSILHSTTTTSTRANIVRRQYQ